MGEPSKDKLVERIDALENSVRLINKSLALILFMLGKNAKINKAQKDILIAQSANLASLNYAIKTIRKDL